MRNVSVARRYARALIEIASDSARLDSVGEQLSTLKDAMEKNRDLAALFSDPSYTRDQRQGVLKELMKVGRVDELPLQNLMMLLVDRHRMPYLPDIVRAFRIMADARAGRLHGTVTAARALSPDALGRLEQALERLTQRKVALESKVDPTLLGGITAQVGSVVYDGSLRTQLDDLHRQLTR